MKKQVFETLSGLRANNKKGLAVLLDPDKVRLDDLGPFVLSCNKLGVTFFFVGGSLISDDQTKEIVSVIKAHSKIPVVIFPGSNLHIEPTADAILLLSLISGRNPEFLIGQHVVAAPMLKRSGLEIMPTAYLLVDSGTATTVSYISNTMPLPANKPDVAACTAMAGEMLGLKLTYLDGGSGAQNPVPASLIAAVKKATETPLIVGGGINSIQKAESAFRAGADLIVVGNALEKSSEFLFELCMSVSEFGKVNA